jgi:exopolyphosphatase/guanosine-5'-triphosphate,3'-diphosphate pyrophosphatase
MAGSTIRQTKPLTPLPWESDRTDWLDEALALARACDYEVDHTHQVTRLALSLFDELADWHRLADEQRHWLAGGALLHDIGWIEGQKAHHKTALRYIRTSDLLGWDQRLRLIVGSIARYHRKALPKPSHDHFAALDQNDRHIVRKLSAILRVADGLDYSHTSIVRAVGVNLTDRRAAIRCLVDRPADVETARAKRKADLIEKLSDKEFEFSWHLPSKCPTA